MSIKINHLKYRVSTLPKIEQSKWGREFVELNLVFTVSQDDEFYPVFKSKTKDYVEKSLIADIEVFKKEGEGFLNHLFEHGTSKGFNRQLTSIKGYELQNNILRYLPKFDRFQFREFLGWYELVQGAINDLRDLQLGVNKSRTTDSCLLCHILDALEYHWD